MAYQGIANTHMETEKNLRVSVLPIIHRLQDDVKAKEKELTGAPAKGFKAVDKARGHTQVYMDRLAQRTGSFDAPMNKPDPTADPYVVQRGLYYRLNKQIIEENSNRQEVLQVQDSFQQFETHVLQAMQQSLATFEQFVGGQAERTKGMYADMVSTAQHIPLDFEWRGFLNRNNHMLMDGNAPPRALEHVSFAHQNHHSTQPLIEGTLERKSRLMVKSYSSGYYVVTKSKFLHEFKDNDNTRKDPTPELSLYLPDCTVGAVDGPKFTIKGKDISKTVVGIKMSTTHELSFKAHSPQDAERWYEVVRSVSGGSGADSSASAPSGPSSPAEKRQASGSQSPEKPQVQTQGVEQGQVTGQQTVASPTSAGAEKSAAAPTTATQPATGSGTEKTVAPAAVQNGSEPHQGQVSGVTGEPGQ